MRLHDFIQSYVLRDLGYSKKLEQLERKKKNHDCG